MKKEKIITIWMIVMIISTLLFFGGSDMADGATSSGDMTTLDPTGITSGNATLRGEIDWSAFAFAWSDCYVYFVLNNTDTGESREVYAGTGTADGDTRYYSANATGLTAYNDYTYHIEFRYGSDGGVVFGSYNSGNMGVIRKLHDDGTLNWTVNFGSSLMSIAVDEGGYVYATSDLGLIRKYTPNGTLLYSIAITSYGYGPVHSVTGFDVDDTYIYLTYREGTLHESKRYIVTLDAENGGTAFTLRLQLPAGSAGRVRAYGGMVYTLILYSGVAFVRVYYRGTSSIQYESRIGTVGSNFGAVCDGVHISENYMFFTSSSYIWMKRRSNMENILSRSFIGADNHRHLYTNAAETHLYIHSAGYGNLYRMDLNTKTIDTTIYIPGNGLSVSRQGMVHVLRRYGDDNYRLQTYTPNLSFLRESPHSVPSYYGGIIYPGVPIDTVATRPEIVTTNYRSTGDKSFKTLASQVTVEVLNIYPLDTAVIFDISVTYLHLDVLGYTDLLFDLKGDTIGPSDMYYEANPSAVRIDTDGTYYITIDGYYSWQLEQNLPLAPGGNYTLRIRHTKNVIEGPPEDVLVGLFDFTLLSLTPDIITLPVADITNTTATVSALVVCGGELITAHIRVVDNATGEIHRIDDTEFSRSGMIRDTITGLAPNHDYTVYGYGLLTNSTGTHIITGNEVYFSTPTVPPTYNIFVHEIYDDAVVFRHEIDPVGYTVWVGINYTHGAVTRYISRLVTTSEPLTLYTMVDDVSTSTAVNIFGRAWYGYTGIPDNATDYISANATATTTSGGDAHIYPAVLDLYSEGVTHNTAVLTGMYFNGLISANAAQYTDTSFRFIADVAEPMWSVRVWNITDYQRDTRSYYNQSDIIEELDFLSTYTFDTHVRWDRANNGTYWYVFAANDTFTTAWQDPIPLTLFAANINGTQAQLMGLADWGTVNYSDTAAYFQFYNVSDPANVTTTANTTQTISYVPFHINATGLTPGVNYTFRAVAVHNVSSTPVTQYGDWVNFTAYAHTIPTLNDTGATNITHESAILGGYYNTAVNITIFPYYAREYYIMDTSTIPGVNYTAGADNITTSAVDLEELTTYGYFYYGIYYVNVHGNDTVYYVCYNTTHPLSFTTGQRPPTISVAVSDMGISSCKLSVSIELHDHDYVRIRYTTSYDGNITQYGEWVNVTADGVRYMYPVYLRSGTEYNFYISTHLGGNESVLDTTDTLTATVAYPTALTAFTADYSAAHEGGPWDTRVSISFWTRLHNVTNYTATDMFGLHYPSPHLYIITGLTHSSTYYYLAYTESTYYNSTGVLVDENATSNGVRYTTLGLEKPTMTDIDVSLSYISGVMRVSFETHFTVGDYHTIKIRFYWWELAKPGTVYFSTQGTYSADDVFYTVDTSHLRATDYGVKAVISAWETSNTTDTYDLQVESNTVQYRTYGYPGVDIDSVYPIYSTSATISFTVELAYEFTSNTTVTITLYRGSVAVQNTTRAVTSSYETYTVTFSGLAEETEYRVVVSCEGYSDSKTFTTLANVVKLLGEAFANSTGVVLAIAFGLLFIVGYLSKSALVGLIAFFAVILIGSMGGYINAFYPILSAVILVMYTVASYKTGG